jgi:hypothetical protein
MGSEKSVSSCDGAMVVTFVILAAAIQNLCPGYGPLATAVQKLASRRSALTAFSKQVFFGNFGA